jgi:membrane-bound ClpP family serine protease
MWTIAGLLLGLVLITSLVGFHTGPHTHLVAGVFGGLAAAWLLFMASDGQSAPLLWVLFGADLVVSAGIGVMGWVAIRHAAAFGAQGPDGRVEGAEGVAVTDLRPDGVVRVHGEEWSATSVNGPLPAGSSVQVLHGGVRLEVWGEQPDATPGVPPPHPAEEANQDERKWPS